MFFPQVRARLGAHRLPIASVACLFASLIATSNLYSQCATIISPNTEPGVLGNEGGGFGFRIAPAGDVNGDGFDDFIVGAPDEDVSGNEDAGRAYVISGADRAVLHTVAGAAADDRFGFSVAGGGDFDGDGTPDFAVGANEADPGGFAAAGSVYIYSGATGSLLHQVNGTAMNETAGHALAFAGNIPRTGAAVESFDDLVIGIPTTNPLGPGGRVVVVGKKIVQNPMTLAFEEVIEETTINRPGSERQFGFAVAGVGDYDGDSIPDIAIGAPSTTGGVFPISITNAGSALIYSGSNLSTILLNTTGDAANVRLGSSACAAGHFDGGTQNLAAFGARGSGSTFGSFHVFKHGALLTPVLRINDIESNTSFGAHVSFAGDADNDGFDDVLIGANGITASQPGGNTYLIGGSAATGVETVLLNPRVQFNADSFFGVLAGQSYGFGVGHAGNLDLDNDSVADFLIGATGVGAAGAFNGAGTVYVFAHDGTCDPPAPQNVAVVTPAAGATILGTAVQFAANADNADQVEFFVNGTSVGIDTTNTFEVFFDSTEFPNGAANLEATASNAFGSTTSPAIAVTIANPPPSNVLITAPAAGTILTGPALVTGSADDAKEMEFYVNGLSVGVDTSAPFAATFNSADFPDGAASLDAEARSPAGETAAPTVAVVIDNTTPVIDITMPDDGAIIGGGVDFVASANDPSGIESVHFAAGAFFSDLDVDGSDGWRTIYDSTLDPDGPITMSIEVEDGAGLVSFDSISVTVDNTDPTVAITSHADEDWVLGVIVIEADAADAHLDRVVFFAGGTEIFVDADGSDGFSASFDTTMVTDGVLALEAVAYDAANNLANSVVTVQVDNTVPTELIRRPADGATVDDNVRIVVQSSDGGSGVARLQIFAESQLLVDTTNASAIVIFDSHTVIDGPLEIIAVVEDVAGNVTTDSISVIVDNLRFKLRPERLKLSSGGNGEPVELVVRGPSVDLLVPVMSHGFQLDLVGGGTIEPYDGDATNDDNKIVAQFDRVEMIALINAAFPAPPSEVTFEVIADGQIMGTVSLRVRP